MRKIIVFVLLSFLSFIFCTKNSITEPENPPVNHSPVITSMTAVPQVLNINMAGQVDSAVVNVIATDVDDTCLTYSFNCFIGRLYYKNDTEIEYFPPAMKGDYIVSCTVSDGKDFDVDSISVHVNQQERVSKIAFVRYGIWVMNADGSGQTSLNCSGGTPCWSPDGSKIAFWSSRDKLWDHSIWVMNADGSNQTRLTYDGRSQDESPSWSPDGKKIAFESEYSISTAKFISEIYIMDTDGSNIINLTNNEYYDLHPSWSPDGSKITFMSNRDYIPGTTSYINSYEIYVMNSDGSNPTRLTNNFYSDGQPSWSPDSSKIAFHSKRDGNYEIYVMNPDGSNKIRLTYDPAPDQGPNWSPDGSKIAFHSYRDGNWEIYIMNADGSNQIRLTYNFVTDSSPSWCPVIK